MSNFRKSTIINPATNRPFNVVNQAYEAASTNKRAESWGAVDVAPNSALSNYLTALRRQSRSAYRNNPYISKGIDNQVSTEIGSGITVRSTTSNEAFKTAADELFSHFINDIDPEGNLSLYGQQAQCSRARRVSGEVFVRKRRRSLTSGHVLPMQCQVLESDFVPVDLHRSLNNNNTIVSGIEFNRRGQRVAYWMYQFHPNERSLNSKYNQLIRVLAHDVIHHFLPTRPGQVRGEPVTVQSLVKANTFDQYDDAELVRKQSRAKFTGFLTREQFSEDDYKFDPFSGEPLAEDGSMMGATVEPGTILQGLPGEKLEMFSGEDPGDNYTSFMRWQSLSTAAGLKIPYEIVTGDWEKVNDRIMRAVLHEYRRQIDMDCDHLMKFQICRRIWHWAMDAGVLANKLPVGDYLAEREELLKHEWRAQGHPYMHPEQDINAKTKGIKNNVFSIKDTVSATGKDANTIMNENLDMEVNWHEQRKTRGLLPLPYPSVQDLVESMPEVPGNNPDSQD
jgi:lambda family phage portal protein